MVKGRYASSVAEAAEMDARSVIQALAYDSFLADYESTYYAINKSETK